MDHVVAATPINQNVILVTRKPGIEPIEDAIECRPCNQLPALGAEDADGSLRAGNDVEHAFPKEWREQPAAGAEDDQIVILLRLIELAGSQMMNAAFTRQHRIDQLAAQPRGEIVGIVA